MSHAFSIARSRCTEVSDPALREEILGHTGNPEATSSILRSIERFGGDVSIERYEMTPKPNSRSHRGGKGTAWTVRAVRAEAPGSGAEGTLPRGR